MFIMQGFALVGAGAILLGSKLLRDWQDRRERAREARWQGFRDREPLE